MKYHIKHMDYVETVKHVNGTGSTKSPMQAIEGIVHAGMKVSGHRVDELFAVPLPHAEERKEIFEIHLRKRNRDPENFDVALLAEKTDRWVGAEIEAAIEDAMFTGFADGRREFTTQDILKSIQDTTPQSERDVEELNSLNDWIEQRGARLVSSPEGVTKKKGKAGVRRLKVANKKGDTTDGED